jgi:CubicO group peptidase (beta-lactamase class C family)
VLVRARGQAYRWLRYVLKVEPAPPHRVEGLFLMPATPEEIPKDGDGLTPEAAVAEFAKEVDRLIAASGFSGVVLLARGPEIALQRVAGEANREHHVPVKADTVFGLASMNKMFTAVALGRLVEDGRIAWSDPVGKHLRGWLPDDRAQTVTIHQLLTHTAGLGDYLSQIADDPKIRTARSLSAYRDLVRAATIEGKPEDGLRYSNTGYVVLGALIEAVTGRDYYDFVQEQVYARAGMTRSGSWAVDEIVENRATGYVSPERAEAAGLGRGWRTNTTLQGVRGTSAGGGLSTAGDMLRFARAIVDGKLVKRETLDALLEPRVRFPVGGHYGYGFVVHAQSDGKRVFGHAGGGPGVNGELKIYGDGAWTLVVLSNASAGAGDIVGAWDGIAARSDRSSSARSPSRSAG